MKMQHLTRLVSSSGFALIIYSLECASGALADSKSPAASFDKREDALPASQVSAERQRAEAELQQRKPGIRVDYDAITGSPVWIGSGGFLSRTTEAEIERTGDLGLAPDDPYRAIKAFLIENEALFEHGPEVLSTAALTRDYVTEHNGMRTVAWQQQLDDIPVFESALKGHITKRGQLVNLSSRFLPDVENAAGLERSSRQVMESAPAISAPQAHANALMDVGEPNAVDAVAPAGAASATPEKRQKFKGPSLFGEASVGLVWLPMNRSAIGLCWEVDFVTRSTVEAFRCLVDARSGEVLVRQNGTSSATPATYNVFTSDSPTPLSPGWATATIPPPDPPPLQPPVVSRQLVALPYLSAVASPSGWIADGDNSTAGNNVRAALYRNGTYPFPENFNPDYSGSLVEGYPSRVFDFPLDLGQDPVTYGNAAVVNLFYWCNWMHDKLYALGFTEAAGNFQDNNFGRGGLGGDRVVAFAQFGANNGYGQNSTFVQMPDGSHGYLLMYTWPVPAPDRDGDLDAELICHEYTHGMNGRLAGYNGKLTHAQAIGLDEGWADFFALSLLSQATDNIDGNYAFAAYSTYLWTLTPDNSNYPPLTQNYFFGFRRYPYSTVMSKNPLTFKDIDLARFGPGNWDPHPGTPYNPTFRPPELTPNERHNRGEVWCVTLWEARKNLIGSHGYWAGDNIMLQLVTDGMKLCPDNPTFLQARDAILEADAVNNCAANWLDLHVAFAKRGMGWGALVQNNEAPSGPSGVVESFSAEWGGLGPPCDE